ncbi:hypothetical protein AB0F43_31785 [Kribbella sp. NPDC023972]|uniref:hypothetical protein n=1 Tax=Kribbella sp. NPDC023972 TaxID=3154795 RepID=UPI00340B4BD0
MITDGFVRIPEHQLAHDPSGCPIAPRHPGELAWAYELIEPGTRVYGVDADAVLAALIDNYPLGGPETARAAARTRHAMSTAHALTAARVAAHRGALPARQDEALRNPAWVPLALTLWDCAVTLTLVDVVYAPFTTAPAPIGNVRWLHSSDADSYLLSLCEAGATTAYRAGVR